MALVRQTEKTSQYHNLLIKTVIKYFVYHLLYWRKGVPNCNRPRVTTLRQECFSYAEYIPPMTASTESKWVVWKTAMRKAKGNSKCNLVF